MLRDFSRCSLPRNSDPGSRNSELILDHTGTINPTSEFRKISPDSRQDIPHLSPTFVFTACPAEMGKWAAAHHSGLQAAVKSQRRRRRRRSEGKNPRGEVSFKLDIRRTFTPLPAADPT
ncbi:hypothetical protein F2P81_024394 [Scophthalmus maximus]|uniref:Uncharacterized protein n=1 Tax=Scophthalmus maximus TaxID=52904 RepID=A0A6A4RZG2_SCOMX|nr:hypothetical protein F2P81_024394 [Scophthalmus maximus]